MAGKLLSMHICNGVVRNYQAVLTEPSLFPRVLVCHQQTRGRRRSKKPPSWFVQQSAATADEGLTEENQEFLESCRLEQYVGSTSPLKTEPLQRHTWTKKTKRTGVLAIKIGAIPQWKKDGTKFYTTLLQVIDNHVIRYTPPEKFSQSLGWKPFWKDQYGSVVVGALSCDPYKFSKQYVNLFKAAAVPPKQKLTRFLVTPDAAIEPGTPLNVMHFKVGDYVDCQAKTIDYGFQGVIKRWGMKGQIQTHGTTKQHRKMGSAGGGREKAGVWKGKKMEGHMGDDWKVMKGLKIWRINTKYNVLYVTGRGIPGPTHSYVRVYDTVLQYRRAAIQTPPAMPTYYPGDSTEPVPEELFDEELFQFTDNSIAYKDTK